MIAGYGIGLAERVTEIDPATGLGVGRPRFVGDSFDADCEGPRRLGMRSLLIDPDRRRDVPEDQRISAVARVEAAMHR